MKTAENIPQYLTMFSEKKQFFVILYLNHYSSFIVIVP